MPPETEIKRGQNRGWGFRDWLVGGSVFLGAAALMVFGVQGVVRDLDRLPSQQFVENKAVLIGAGQDEASKNARATALSMFEAIPENSLRAEDLRRWAGVQLSVAKQTFEERAFDQVRAHLEKARDLARLSLRGNLVHPLSWAYLAEARMAQGDDDSLDDGYSFLKTSYAMAPVEPDYFVYRFQVALATPERWDVDLLRALRRDFSAVLAQDHWRPAVRAFLEMAKSDPRVVRISDILVGDDPEMLERWERLQRRLQP